MYNISEPIYKSIALSILTIGFLFISFNLPAQNNINMPYSMFGIGEIRFNHYAQNMGMGGINQAFRSNMSVNDVNPAAYTAIDTTSFVFDATVVSHFYGQKTNSISQYSDYVSLGNISMGFPITRWWAFGAGLKPYSLMGYSIRDKGEHPMAGGVNYIYEGRGGLSQLFIGTAINPINGLSLGINASYVFGNMFRETSVVSDSAGVYITNRLLSDNANGWVLGLGMQYQLKFDENKHLTIGATFGQKSEIDNSSTETLRRRMLGSVQFDTIVHRNIGDGYIALPRYYGAGLYARFNYNWSAGLDFQWQNWEDFNLADRKDSFNDSYQIAFGVMYRPTVETYSPFFHRMQYTTGFRFGQSYINYDNESLNEFGISFGVFIPVRRVFSGMKIAFEYSQRGNVDNHYMQENFYRINMGINIYERWFLRRRFN